MKREREKEREGMIICGRVKLIFTVQVDELVLLANAGGCRGFRLGAVVGTIGCE